MPELPEVETVCRGISPHLLGKTVHSIVVRHSRLRWPVSATLGEILNGQTVRNVLRRGKYLLVGFDAGTLLFHLGMSGSLCIVAKDTPVEKHDHLEVVLAEYHMRYRDPRRFGAVLWHPGPIESHPLICSLGLEPLQANFNGAMLYQLLQQRTASVKQLIMNQRIVVGIGNIYANEALFYAGIHPERGARQLTPADCSVLVNAIRNTLEQAIEAGGSTLRDFVNARGKPGYFQHRYQVYGRANLACYACTSLIRQIRQGQRSTYYCPHCQT